MTARNSYRRITRIVAVPLSAALALLGATSVGATVNASPSARGVTSTTIRIAGDLTETVDGVPSSFTAGESIGAQAEFWYVNHHGGVLGRKVDYLGAVDDTASSATLAANISKQILTENVFAIAPFATNANVNTTFIASNDVPMFGNATSVPVCESKWVWGLGGCLVANTYAETTAPASVAEDLLGHGTNPQTGAIKVPRGTTWALEGNPDVAFAQPELTAAAKADGFTVCDFDYSVPVTATDFSPYAAKIMSSCNQGKGPTALFIALTNLAEDASYVTTLRSLGWKGTVETEGSDPAALKAPDTAKGLQGMVTYTDDISAPAKGEGPIFGVIRKALVGIGQAGYAITTPLLDGWIDANMVVEALEHAGAKNLTPAKFGAAIQHWTYPGVAGLTPEYPFPKSHTFPIPCWNVEKVENGNYVQIYPLECGQVVDIATGKVVAKGFKV